MLKLSPWSGAGGPRSIAGCSRSIAPRSPEHGAHRLAQFFPRADAAREGLYPLRVALGLAMVVTIVLGFTAARRRDFARHRAWLIRSYAIGLVAGTQVFTLGFGAVIFGTGDLTTALLLGAAWAINLAVAERRRWSWLLSQA